MCSLTDDIIAKNIHIGKVLIDVDHIVGPVEPHGSAVIVAVVVVVSVCGVLLAVLVSVGIVIGCCLKKREPHEVEYEDPDNIMANRSVGGEIRSVQFCSQPPTELEEQTYEELESFKPDPHTQGNMAYGQVQFTQ